MNATPSSVPDNEPANPALAEIEKLGIDSMQAMELLTEIETTFGVETPDYELQGVTTFSGIAALVRRRLG